MTYYVGSSPADIPRILDGLPRFLYAIRRDDLGNLYMNKVDQLRNDKFEINRPGPESENFNDFAIGTDYFEGRLPDHTMAYDNLIYEQYKWLNQNYHYYIDENGYLVAKLLGI